MIKSRKTIFIFFIVVICLSLFFIPTIVCNYKLNKIDSGTKYTNIIGTKKIYSYSDLNNVLDNSRYEIKINDESNVIYENKLKISVNISDFQATENYSIEYAYNNTKKIEKINDKKDIKYLNNFNEGKNSIEIKLLKDNNPIMTTNKDIYYVKKYAKQFNDENEKTGICVHYRDGTKEKFNKSGDLLVALGAKNIRTDFLYQAIERNNGRKVFSDYDSWINELQKKTNINIIVLLGCDPYAGDGWLIDSDEEIKEYNRFVCDIMEHYPNVKYYELLNEMNMDFSYRKAYLNQENIAWYDKLMEYIQKNKVRNNVQIINTGTATPNENKEGVITSENFYTNLFNLDKMKYSNTITYHPYAHDNINELKQKIDSHANLNKKFGGFNYLNVTEYGVSSKQAGENEKAKELIKETNLLKKTNNNLIILYDLWTTANDTNSYEQFGLLNNIYEPTLSYYSMKNYYQNTNGSEYIGQIKLIDGLEAHVYDKDGKPKIIAWAIDSSKPVTINYDGFTATDLYGNAIENTNGKLEITDSQVYLDNVSTNYFYQAISNSITEGYSDFNSKFKDEIAKVNGLSNKINSLNQTTTSLKNMSTLDENTANNLMKSHFELGNDLINAYNNGSLNVEYVKLSSMLDSLNTIGNSYEDLVSVSAKTRMNDLTDITNEVNNANSIIENNEKFDIVYPEKIYKFSKDLLDTSSYVLGLEEENDIKTGLINSKALHAKYLANWSQEFSQTYINDALKKPINKIIADNEAIINNILNGISKNSDILNSYATLKNNLNNLITNETENNLDKVNNAYTNQMNLIKVVVNKYNSEEIKINDSTYKTMIENFVNLSDDYKELYELYKTDNDTISTKEVEETLNKVINRYNDNKDKTNDFTNETDIINKMTELFNELFDRSQNPAVEVQSVENYLKKQRILKTCDIASSMLENDIKQKADSEYNAITISSDKGINSYTNQDETITINLPKNAQVTSESSNGFKFTANGTKDVKLSIRGYDYTYTINVNNIDKTVPKVTAQNGQSLKINATDDNLKEIKIEKDGKETAVNNGQTITIPGIYKITATDKAGNSTNETAIVYGTYTNEQNTKVNYVTIRAKTKVSDVKQDGDYTVKDNSITAGIKRAPSRVNNTNVEKDSNSYIATGDILQDNNNTYTVITIGDLSSNGDVGAADLIKLRKSLVGLTKLTKLQELAADTNQNGSVNVSDLLKERKIMVGIYNL